MPDLMDNPDGIGEAKFQDAKCIDRIRLFIKVDKDNISEVSCISDGCKAVREAADFLVNSLKNKSLNNLKIDLKEIKIKHAFETAEKALKRTIDNYNQFKKDPLDEIISMTQKYDEGYLPRDPRYDFEF
mgnify:CR=1 FL=1